RPDDPKVALVAAGRGAFNVRPSAGGPAVFEGTASPPAGPGPASGGRGDALDFTALRAPGGYVVALAGGPVSPSLPGADERYRDALQTVVRSFTYQRCGAPITDGSPLARPACHLEDAREWGQSGPGPRRDVTGGWHDAGDYGKYVPPAGITLWHLGMIQ